MYRLFVIQDAIPHYQLYDQDESLEEMKKRATKYDEQGLCWLISNEGGKPVEFSQVYQVYCQAIDFVVRKFHDTRSGY